MLATTATSVKNIEPRTPIAALYKTSTTEGVIKLFFQDVLGGIRLNSYDNSWNGGTSSFATAKLGTPLAAIGSSSLDKASPFPTPCTWFQGALDEKRIKVAPYSQIAAVYLPDNEIRLYCQKEDDTIQEYTVDTNLGGALPGTSIAATAYFGTTRIRVFFQKPDLTIKGIGSDSGEWRDMGLNVANSIARGAIAIVSYIDPLHNSDFSVRIYYTVADNRTKEKIYNAGTQSGWVEGTLDTQTIPGSNFDVIVWTSGDSVILRAYLQQGQQVSAISEWSGTTSQWALGHAALSPAKV
ncbi:hypothetical protein IFR05_002605 [Cadophora sp. M221]|nr:hypothetical protein IFR05_002605 [Cadophora sp. M221]